MLHLELFEQAPKYVSCVHQIASFVIERNYEQVKIDICLNIERQYCDMRGVAPSRFCIISERERPGQDGVLNLVLLGF